MKNRGKPTTYNGTRILTRIITYLSEEKTQAGITEITEACCSTNRICRDGITWLLSNKIIIQHGGIIKAGNMKYYSINPEFEKIKNCRNCKTKNGGDV